MNDIFVSYRRSDSSAIVGRVIDRLETNFGQEHIFRDLDSIEYGQDFGEVIKEALGECEVLLLIIGDEWIHVQDDDGVRRLDKSDDWVRVEVTKALEIGIHVIPVLVKNAIMPSADQLPEGLKSLATRNAAKVRDDPDFNIDIERLCATIKKRLSKTREETKKPFTKSAVLIAVAVTLTAMGGLILTIHQAGIIGNNEIPNTAPTSPYEKSFKEIPPPPTSQPREKPEIPQPSKNWFVILGSFPKEDRLSAQNKIRRLHASDYIASIIDTDNYSNLRNGLWAVVMGPYEWKNIAVREKEKIAHLVPDAYVKSSSKSTQTKLLYTYAGPYHLGDETIKGWPEPYQRCFEFNFVLELQVEKLELKLETYGTENSSINLNGQRAASLPLQPGIPGMNRPNYWSKEHSVILSTKFLKSGSNTFSLCAEPVQNPEFPGDKDDFQIRNIKIIAET